MNRASQTNCRRRRQESHFKEGRAFTLIELLVVIAIIAILAGIAMPVIRGLGGAADATSVSRQLVDDIAIARLRAINERTTVYMVFVPPTIVKENWTGLDKEEQKELDKLMTGQYTMYSLFANRTLGDQPGPGHARYLTEWKTLPQGVFVASNDFTVMMPATKWAALDPTNRPLPYISVPFPLARSQTQRMMPCIAFNYLGQLATRGDQFLHLSKGSVIPAKDAKTGKYVANQEARVIENPKTNWMKNPYIRIDWVTGRPRTVQPLPPPGA
jgi:prepilin-type N-terminal cleavage/methylation domain-containing protein